MGFARTDFRGCNVEKAAYKTLRCIGLMFSAICCGEPVTPAIMEAREGAYEELKVICYKAQLWDDYIAKRGQEHEATVD